MTDAGEILSLHTAPAGRVMWLRYIGHDHQCYAACYHDGELIHRNPADLRPPDWYTVGFDLGDKIALTAGAIITCQQAAPDMDLPALPWQHELLGWRIPALGAHRKPPRVLVEGSPPVIPAAPWRPYSAAELAYEACLLADADEPYQYAERVLTDIAARSGIDAEQLNMVLGELEQ